MCIRDSTNIVISEFTRKDLTGFDWYKLDDVKVKGKEEKVTIYSIY